MIKRRHSITRTIYVTIMLSFAICFSLILLNNFYVITSAGKQASQQLEVILQQQTRRIDSELSGVQSYLTGFIYSGPDLDTIAGGRRDSEYYSAIYRQKANFASFLAASPVIDGIGVYSVPSNEFVYSVLQVADNDTALALRDITRGAAADGTLPDFRSTHWYPMELDGASYIVTCIQVRSNYLFAWTRCSNILDRIEMPDTGDDTFIVLLETGGQYFTADNQPLDTPPAIRRRSIGADITTLDRRYTVARSAAGFLRDNGSLVLLTPDTYMRAQLRASYLILAGALALLTAVAAVTSSVLRSRLGAPMNDLLSSIRQLKEGDFSTRLPESAAYTEFQPVNDAYNDMVSRIRDLKIGIYQEQLKQQQVQSQYLRSQIAPHFFINCLNIIYHLAARSRMDEVQQMTVKLSRHLRYTLSDRPFVALEEELEEIRDYVALSNLRYADAISLHISADDSLLQAQILPMILVPQVENIVKHTVRPGENTDICIEVNVNKEGGLHLRIWDSGEGWSEDNLRTLNNGEAPVQNSGYHIGLSNTVQRLSLTYGETYRILFSNHESAGAQIDFDIPLQ